LYFKIKKTKFVFKTGDISQEKGDVLVLWTTPDLSFGDSDFIKIHQTAGPALYREAQKNLTVIGFKPNPFSPPLLPVGRSLITYPALLEVKRVIHAVLPNYRNEYEQKNKSTLLKTTLYSVFESFQKIQQQNPFFKNLILPPISQKIFGTVLPEHINIYTNFLKDIAATNQRYNITIVCQDPEMLKQYLKNFIKTTQPWYMYIKFVLTKKL
jgi:O-acetyl-ADP-ribose deacetylase (regulator of RNase III)